MHERLDLATATHLVEIVLAGVEREFPNYVLGLLNSEKDLERPRDRTPAFFGCFDWHSAVHSHWTLVRLRRLFPEAAWAEEVDTVLERRLSDENLAGEVRFLERPGNERFELPYGLAWLLQLDAEFREIGRPPEGLEALATIARDRLLEYVERLPFPVRSGEHSQSAFAMGLAFDWAVDVDDHEFRGAIERRALEFHGADVNGPLFAEPSGYDFVSPCLAEADLVRRMMDQIEFANWLTEFLPDVPTSDSKTVWLSPVVCPDPSDGKLSHLDGLNLSRAWMLDGMAHGLPADDPRIATLLAAAAEHGSAGLDAVTGEFYAGAHWLPSFAVYLLTRRGIREPAND